MYPIHVERDIGRVDIDGEPECLERHAPDLPLLKMEHIDPSAVVSDWLAESAPIVCSLSPSAGDYWRTIVRSAEEAYAGWLRAAPTARIGLTPDLKGDRFRSGKYALLEQRVVIMLLKALPAEVKQDAITARTVSATALIFCALCRLQPGSAADKSSMLSFVVRRLVTFPLNRWLELKGPLRSKGCFQAVQTIQTHCTRTAKWVGFTPVTLTASVW